MLREFEISDIEKVMEIWLHSNIEAHQFIPKTYWENNYDKVKELLPQAEVYVYEIDSKNDKEYDKECDKEFNKNDKDNGNESDTEIDNKKDNGKESNKEIVGFVGMDNGYIAGIFIKNSMRSKGIGKELLEFCKDKYDTLSLSVYERNVGAIDFYKREGFDIKNNQIDENTGEEEYYMVWSRGKY
jgi:putative acetyltransferase